MVSDRQASVIIIVYKEIGYKEEDEANENHRRISESSIFNNHAWILK